MKILHFPKLRTFLWPVLLTQFACSSSLTEGVITYEISPGIVGFESIISQSPNPEKKTVYFKPGFIAEPPIGNMAPPFHLHSLYNSQMRQGYDHRDFLGTYFVIEKETGEKLGFIPLKGKKQILGYSCKKGQIQSSKDTAIVWYTPKFSAPYAPWFEGFDKGMVLQIEKKVRFIDWKGNKEEDLVEKDTLQITRAINIQATSPPDSLFEPKRPYKVVPLEVYERSIRNFTPVTSKENP